MFGLQGLDYRTHVIASQQNSECNLTNILLVCMAKNISATLLGQICSIIVSCLADSSEFLAQFDDVPEMVNVIIKPIKIGANKVLYPLVSQINEQPSSPAKQPKYLLSPSVEN